MTHTPSPSSHPTAAAASPRRIAVVGASGRVGRRVGHLLRAAGHAVVPVSRTADPGDPAPHTPVDVLDPAAVRAALAGVDAAVVTLGISENPMAVRLRGARSTADDVRSRGTAHVVEALEATGARRLVVLSSTGVGDSAAALTPGMRLVVAAMLRNQFHDHARQEDVVRASGLNWTIARPVNLREGERPPVVADDHGRVVSMDVGIDQVAACLARWVTTDEHGGQTVALSS
ncbi:NAD(P)-dependent oxidoreductase [Kytococcus sedentarius]|uniref:NAD(P)-dependent oxidoreductase n=1 Tax=Kytococcus sedentarius TaxID=1276 RepID=UPI00384AFB89